MLSPQSRGSNDVPLESDIQTSAIRMLSVRRCWSEHCGVPSADAAVQPPSILVHNVKRLISVIGILNPIAAISSEFG